MNMETKAAIITVGDEILYGHITDTNSAFLANQLTENGFSVDKIISVGDQIEFILEALEGLRNQVSIIVITGGIGPTKDDKTKNALEIFYNSPLRLFPEALEQIKAFLEKRGKPLTELNYRQAWLPANCLYIPNLYGTAPGMWFEENNQVCVSLPGVPVEMKLIAKEQVIPRLKSRFPATVISHQLVKTIGIGESILAENISDWEARLPPEIRLAYLPSIGEVTLRLSIKGGSEEKNMKALSEQVGLLQPLIHQYIYGYNDISVAEAVGQLLTQTKLNVATAESCTGGAIAAALTSVAGSSAYLLGGVVAYQNEIKINMLGVSESTLKEHGAVSEQTVIEMARGIRQHTGASIGVSSSGIAGPAGGTPEKPVGTVWIACADIEGVITQKLNLNGTRETNINQTVVAVFALLIQRLTRKS